MLFELTSAQNLLPTGPDVSDENEMIAAATSCHMSFTMQAGKLSWSLNKSHENVTTQFLLTFHGDQTEGSSNRTTKHELQVSGGLPDTWNKTLLKSIKSFIQTACRVSIC